MLVWVTAIWTLGLLHFPCAIMALFIASKHPKFPVFPFVIVFGRYEHFGRYPKAYAELAGVTEPQYKT